jgi:hypothetical protein
MAAGTAPGTPARRTTRERTPEMFTPPMTPPRRTHRLRNWLLGTGAAAVVLVAGLGGCAALVSSAANHVANPDAASAAGAASGGTGATAPATPADSSAPAGPVSLPLGDPMSVSQDGSDAATIVLGRKVISDHAADAYSEGPQNGYFVAVHVSVTGAAGLTSGFDINPLDFYALTGSTHYDEGDGNAYEGPEASADLSATSLNAGEQAGGWLVFDLPAPHGQIAYAPNLDGQPLAYWKF